MLFTSKSFLVFLPSVLFAYFIFPKKLRYIWLLISSLFFYMYLDPLYIILILFPTVITYMGGIYIDDNKGEVKTVKYNKTVLILGIIATLSLLLVFKYSNFIIDIFNLFISIFNKNAVSNVEIYLPVGISFYTFQTIGYLIDVYRGDTKAERNILKYALFVTFFPQLVAGPIERSKSLLKQINNLDKIKLLNKKRIISGIITILYGYFLKMVIADRAAILVNNVFSEYHLYGSVELCVAAVFFAIQIYADFGGYTFIAIGIAKVIGVDLMQNFNSPYLSCSVKDFWSRWHISLSTWFRDYLYIPLGGNRKGRIRMIINKIVVFSLSGLWHGANLSFVIWGLIHGIGQIIEDTIGKIIDNKLLKKYVNKNCFSWKMLKILITFIFVTFAWIFFRAGNIYIAFGYIKNIICKPDIWKLFDGSIYSLGLNVIEMNILIVSLLFVSFFDYIGYLQKKTMDVFVMEQNFFFRVLLIIILLFSIIVFGEYGSGFDGNSFIYFQF